MSSEVDYITEYLRTRPIAPILKRSVEKDNLIALKFMYILDYEMEQRKLYGRIQNIDSASLLMMQLMQFHSFESFRFYDYVVKQEVNKLVLQCSSCGLIGPYASMQTHMAINHNVHIASKMCGYCNCVELREHFDNNTIGRCLVNYLNERNISEWDTNVCNIVAEFYDILRNIAEKFSIITTRRKNYAAKRWRVTTKKAASSNIKTKISVLDDEYNQIKSLLNAQMVEEPRSNIDNQSSLLTTAQNNQSIQTNDDAVADDEVLFVVEVKNEPPLVIEAQPQCELSSSGPYYRRNDSVILNSAIEDKSNLIKTVSNMQGENSPKRRRIDASYEASPVDAINEVRYLVSDDEDEDDDVVLVDAIKNEPTPNVEAKQNEPYTIGTYFRSQSRDSVITESISSADLMRPSENHHLRRDAEEFGRFVAQCLSKLPTEIQRRKLEIEIEAVILNAKKAAFQ